MGTISSNAHLNKLFKDVKRTSLAWQLNEHQLEAFRTIAPGHCPWCRRDTSPPRRCLSHIRAYFSCPWCWECTACSSQPAAPPRMKRERQFINMLVRWRQKKNPNTWEIIQLSGKIDFPSINFSSPFTRKRNLVRSFRNYLNKRTCCQRWIEGWQGPQVKHIVASETEILAIERNRSASLHTVNELNWKCRVCWHRVGVANDIVHSAVRQFQLKGWNIFELRCIYGTLKVYKLNHGAHWIRWIRFDDLVSDTQFSAGPSNVELVFQQVIIVCR